MLNYPVLIIDINDINLLIVVWFVVNDLNSCYRIVCMELTLKIAHEDSP